MAVAINPGTECELPPIVVDISLPAKRQSRFALNLYLVNFFHGVLVATDDAEKWRAAQAVARCPGLIPSASRFASPAVVSSLQREMRERGLTETRNWLRDAIFPAASIEVSRLYLRKQYIRLGKDWLFDSSGYRVFDTPGDALPVGWFARWLRQNILREASVLISGYQTRDLNVAAAHLSPTLLSLARFLHTAELAPIDRRTLTLATQGLSTTDIARDLGIRVSTLRQRIFRLKKRLKGIAAIET